jgi:hypothetical protein
MATIKGAAQSRIWANRLRLRFFIGMENAGDRRWESQMKSRIKIFCESLT